MRNQISKHSYTLTPDSPKCCFRHTRGDIQHTHFQLFPEDGPLAERGAVPAAVLELELALVDGHLRALTDHDERVRPALTDDALPGRQAGDLVAYDARSQRQHGGESPEVDQRRASSYLTLVANQTNM